MNQNNAFTGQLYRLVERAEIILLLALIVSVVAHYSGISGARTGIVVSLGGLAGVYFLTAFRPPASQPGDGAEKPNFTQLLSQTTLPKLLWISCAVGAAGLTMYHTTPNGYREMLLIHSATTIPGALIIGVLAAQGASAETHTHPLQGSPADIVISLHSDLLIEALANDS